METEDKERKENPGSNTSDLEAKTAELVKTKAELKRAKDNAMLSWLDSKPLIDELERLKATLASAKNRCSMSNMIVSELQAELDSTTKSIMSKKEEEVNATMMIKELSQALAETRQELEALKLATDEERRARSNLKQVLRRKRQKLRTSQLALRATRIESEACRASAAEALRCIGISETDGAITVQMTQEEYHALKRRAEEEASLAEWRVSVSMEQREGVEASRDFALSRLQETRLRRRSRMSVKDEKIAGQEAREMAEELDSKIKAEGQENRGFAFPKARAKLINAESSRSRGKSQQMRRSKSNNNNGNSLVKKRRTSILRQIKDFIVRSITRLFG